MSDRSFIEWNGNTADDQRTARRKTMQVVANPAAHTATIVIKAMAHKTVLIK